MQYGAKVNNYGDNKNSILKNNSYSYQKILNEDLYDNIMSTIVDKYYVLFENTSVNGIEKVYYYDLEKEILCVLKEVE